MPFSKKKNKDFYSRYSWKKEQWPDEDNNNLVDNGNAASPGWGYGVKDSYQRQASYGRPDGYYDSSYARLDEDTSGASRSNSSGGNKEKRDTGSIDSSKRQREAEDAGYSYGVKGAPIRRNSRNSYSILPDDSGKDDWDDPDYDDRYDERSSGSYIDDRYFGRADAGGSSLQGHSGKDRGYTNRRYGGDGIGNIDGANGGDGIGNIDGANGRDVRKGRDSKERNFGKISNNMTAGGQVEGTGEVKKRKNHTSRRDESMIRNEKSYLKRRSSFWRKLILLIVLTIILIIVWRFSRMERSPLSDILINAGIETNASYQDFVIYGVDSREGSLTSDTHSDTIIICSLNKSTEAIKMVSVYRDTYLDNTNGEYRKATECYFYGGPSRSVNMLNKNLDLDIEDYITVDFNAVVKAVDLIGGVDVEVTEEELPYINGYQTENAEVTGAEITPVTEAGYQHLNGIQALAYCRIRYTAGYDFRRTERQRTVLTQIFQNAKSQGAVKLIQVVDAMLPYIATSFSNTELISLATRISEYTLSDSTGFPFDLETANISAGDCVVPVNLAQNVSQLHAFLFGTEGYVPSETVQEISNEIANSTGIY